MSPYKNQEQRAAALRYTPDLAAGAPVVVASGMGYAAQKIIEIAEDSHIPVYQDDTLATLLSQLDAGTEIPPELYQAVADLYLYFLSYGQEENLPQTEPALQETVPEITAQAEALPEEIQPQQPKELPPPSLPDFSEDDL